MGPASDRGAGCARPSTRPACTPKVRSKQCSGHANLPALRENPQKSLVQNRKSYRIGHEYKLYNNGLLRLDQPWSTDLAGRPEGRSREGKSCRSSATSGRSSPRQLRALGYKVHPDLDLKVATRPGLLVAGPEHAAGSLSSGRGIRVPRPTSTTHPPSGASIRVTRTISVTTYFRSTIRQDPSSGAWETTAYRVSAFLRFEAEQGDCHSLRRP
jgi:hypothetical protein